MNKLFLFHILIVFSVNGKSADLPFAVNQDGKKPVPVITAHGHCAWPNLTLLKDGRTIAAVIFNNASHGHRPGDVESWLSGDGGITWKFGSAATQHEPETIRMNHAAGLAQNGDLIVLTGGWSNRWPPGVAQERGSFRYKTLGAWMSRSPYEKKILNVGVSWNVDKKSFPQKTPGELSGTPFGNLQIADNGDLCASVYSPQKPWKTYSERQFRSWLYRSKDDGRTWDPQPVVIGPDANETTTLHLGKGKWLAAARTGSGVDGKDQVQLYASDDDAKTWTHQRTMTGFQRVNGNLAKLRDGSVVFSYGDRASESGQKGIEAMISRDQGKTWSDEVRLANWNGADGGYPSTVQRKDGQMVTAYYCSGLPGQEAKTFDGYHMEVIVWDAKRTFSQAVE